MSPRRLFPIALLCAMPLLQAATIRHSGPADGRAAHITGFLLTPGAEGFDTDNDAPRDGAGIKPANLTSITLTARDTLTSSGMDSQPLYLKIYDSTDRRHLLGCSSNALRWDSPAGVPFRSEQTYTFERTGIPMDTPLCFAFETAAEPNSPLGKAGLSLSSTRIPADYKLLTKDLHKFAGSPPTIAFTVEPAENPPSANLLLLGGTTTALMAAGGAALVILRKKKSRALPPPPGQD